MCVRVVSATGGWRENLGVGARACSRGCGLWVWAPTSPRGAGGGGCAQACTPCGGGRGPIVCCEILYIGGFLLFYVGKLL